MLFRSDFLKRVGLIEEGFGMYFEEADLALRGRNVGFRLAHAAASIVVHKEGGTISPDGSMIGPSVNQVLWSSRSRLLFTWKHYPWFIMNALAAVTMQALTHLSRNRPPQALAALRGMCQFIAQLLHQRPIFTEGKGHSHRHLE